MAMKNPPHPGDLIRTEVIEALGLSVSKAAEILKVRRATLSDLLHGKAALTPEMALRIEKAFGPDMDHLLRMQLAYDVAKTREHARGISIKRYAPDGSGAWGLREGRISSARSAIVMAASKSARKQICAGRSNRNAKMEFRSKSCEAEVKHVSTTIKARYSGAWSHWKSLS